MEAPAEVNAGAGRQHFDFCNASKSKRKVLDQSSGSTSASVNPAADMLNEAEVCVCASFDFCP